MKFQNSSLLLATALISLGMFSCDIPDTAEPVDEPLGQTEDAIGGETGCATISIGSSVNGGTSASYATFSSVDDKYNAGSTCPNQFISEYTNWNTAPFYYYPATSIQQPLPLTSAECLATRFDVYYYAFSGGAWNTTPVGFVKQIGSWSGTACSMVNSTTSGAPPAPGGSVTKMRVVSHAWQNVNISGTNKADFKLVLTFINTIM